MQTYELLYLLPATFSEEELPGIREKIRRLLEKHNGKVLLEDSLGKRRFAYPIKKHRNGYYLTFDFELESSALKTPGQDIALAPEVLRHLVTIKEKQPMVQRRRPMLTDAPTTPVARPTTKYDAEKEKVKLENLDEKLDELLTGKDLL